MHNPLINGVFTILIQKVEMSFESTFLIFFENKNGDNSTYKLVNLSQIGQKFERFVVHYF